MRRCSAAIGSFLVLMSLGAVVAATMTSVPAVALLVVGGSVAVAVRLLWIVATARGGTTRIDD